MISWKYIETDKRIQYTLFQHRIMHYKLQGTAVKLLLCACLFHVQAEVLFVLH